MPQEGVVRDVITDELTGLPADALVEGESREQVKKAIAKSLKKHTDVHVEEVLFTDVTVQ
jgi:flagellar FliL protein